MSRLYLTNITMGTQKKNIILLIIALFVSALIGEAALRILPIPGVAFDLNRYDDLIGNTLWPNAKMIYRNDRGDYVVRKTNRWGWLDRDHRQEKPPGVYRIGFFGDSFVEARQVPLEQAFWSLIEKDLSDSNVETFSFGKTGGNTLQAYLSSSKYGPLFGLDMVVYVFCENDPADNIYEIKQTDRIPYPVLTDDGERFTIDDTFRERYGKKARWHTKIADYLQSHSLLLSTLYKRIRLLLKYGVKTSITEEDRSVLSNKEGAAKTTTATPPSLWPETMRKKGMQLVDVILKQWKEEAGDERKLVVLHVPSGIDTVRLKDSEMDNWKGWLKELCESREIPFIDPIESFRAADRQGESLFYDHFEPSGHEAFAAAFSVWFRDMQRGD